MNEGGYSWPEAILTLTIVVVIFGTLLPLASSMTSKLQMKKAQMYAAETAFQGAIYFKAYGLMEGARQIDGVDYNWMIEGLSVCVLYRVVDEDIQKMCESMKKMDDRGYTLLESIFQLFIMTAFIHLFLLFFFWKDPIEQQYADYSSTQWELFSVDLQQVLADVSEIQILDRGKVLHLRDSYGSIDIEQSGTVIRKRVKGDGHVPLYTGTRSISYTFDGKSLIAVVTMLDGSVKVRGFAVGLYPE